ncbi:MAG: DnaJ domain-containing protein, partial [Haloarculaceae archaeon]
MSHVVSYHPMQGSFYAVLGVDADADDATVRAAYREAVKEHHPDVSDYPDAGERFKRLTSARDVLLDPPERARYDRLGHADYVSRSGRGSASGWSAGSTDSGGGPETAAGGT